MIIIDKPFVSEFLIETIRKHNFPIVSTTEAKELIKDTSLNWISESEAKTILKDFPSTCVYTNSENSINWIENNFQHTNLPSHIKLFKDKILFRELIKEYFPNQVCFETIIYLT